MTLGEYIGQQIQLAIERAVSERDQQFRNTLQNMASNIGAYLLGDVADASGIFGGLESLIGDILAAVGGFVDPAVTALSKAGRTGRGFGFGYLAGILMYDQVRALNLPIMHEINAHTTNELFTPDQAARLVAQGLISADQGRSESSGNGLDVPHFDALYQGQETFPGPPDLFRLLNLGAINEGNYFAATRRQGMPDDYAKAMLYLTRLRLTPADLALAILRGDMDSTAAMEYALQLGMTEEDFGILQLNTGEPPGTMQLLEAYRRGYIDEPTLERGIRQSRVRDEWIPTIERLRFEPMSANEWVKAAVQNHATQDEASAGAARAGLDPADFPIWYENAGRPPGVMEMIGMWRRGIMNDADVEQGIRESDVKDKYIPYLTQLKRQLLSLRDLRQIAQTGSQSAEWLTAYMEQLGYSQEDAQLFWESERTAKVATAKSLKETQILALYEAGAMNDQEAESELGKLGYSSTDARYVLEVQVVKREQADKQRGMTAIRTAYLRGKIDLNAARMQLDQLGILASERDPLLSQWQDEKSSQVQMLTAGEVADAVYYGLVPYADGVARLVSYGWAEAEAELRILIRLHGAPQGITVPTLP
jgi:hypothetical protein